jgi:hypothetical protein
MAVEGDRPEVPWGSIDQLGLEASCDAADHRFVRGFGGIR